MTLILVAMQNSVLIFESSKSGWKTTETLNGDPQTIAFDQGNSDRLYCGTFKSGLLKSDNRGESWERIGENIISSPAVMSVSVDQNGGSKNGFCKVYVGTEPSALYTSTDGGISWEQMDGLNKLDSSSTWSFPPRPWTHHVRWIEIDSNDPNRIFVAIEAGALVQSPDGGKNWIDRGKGSPYDTHTLRTHLKAPERLYVAAGDGYFESFDYGKSWTTPNKGLGHNYLVSLALDSTDPQSVIVSASRTAMQSHAIDQADSVIYRKSKEDEKWHLPIGLPRSEGTLATLLSSNPTIGGEFYGVNNRGIFCSTDSGITWKALEIQWSNEYLLQHPYGIVVSED
jgi:photosystem II stability/assembly factor-like uncharacterized protein